MLSRPATRAIRSEGVKSGWCETARHPAACGASLKWPSASVEVASSLSRSSQPTKAPASGLPLGSRTVPVTGPSGGASGAAVLAGGGVKSSCTGADVGCSIAARGGAGGAANAPGFGTRIHVSSGRKSSAAQSKAMESHTLFGED